MKEKTEKNIKRGRKSRASGAAFEKRVRNDLLDKGWIVDKWSNNVEFNIEHQRKQHLLNVVGKLIQAKNKWAGPNRPMMMSAGFPDFIAFKFYKGYNDIKTYEIIGVECKTRKYLDKEEKEKCSWYLKNHIFSRILIAFKTKEGRRVVVKYKECSDK